MKLLIQTLCSICLILLLTSGAFAQSHPIDNFIQTSANAHEQTSADISDYRITSSHVSELSGITHYYIQQQYKGTPIYNAVIGLHIDAEGQLVTISNNFLSNIDTKINTQKATLSAEAALNRVAQTMQYDMSEPTTFRTYIDGVSIFEGGSISRTDIPAELVYQPMEDGTLRLSWDMSIAEKQDADYWSMRVDAQTGEILNKVNWTVYCDFGDAGCKEEGHTHNHYPSTATQVPLKNSNVANSYTVYDEPIESPIHGSRTVVSTTGDPIASPFGWHDTNGANGAEYTITRGNNVWAMEDANGDNGTGFSPDGTASLDFNFALNLSTSPNLDPSRSAGITNLFYWNNLVHDVWYQYGFDEASGNFQENNYGNGGSSGDYVIADAQDGGGTNNANFSTPTDGGNGYMQMYLWTNAGVGTLNINSPAGTGPYATEAAGFGLASFNITGDLVIVDDGSAAPTEGCGTLVNAGAINGNIAVVDRGTCEFGLKCLNAENAGAIAVIVCNNVAGAAITMAPGVDGASVTIPAVMITQADCAIIRAQIPTVNVNLVSGNSAVRDGDFDNGIIAHEYGHGISIRLTGGANNSNCLSNNEQMGEGWSDWFGMMMTINPTDTRTSIRPIGTFAVGQSTTGSGIRTYPYTTDLSINPHIYTDIDDFTTAGQNGTVSVHGVGSVWCAMLWEMTWDLIDTYGFDPDLHNGTGGNNIAMALVIEGLKLQPCRPGFVDGRDAILAADQALYNGDNQCLIRKAFARRGLGDNASQGTSFSTSDGSNDFNADCGQACASVDLGVNFDGFPGQTTWNITDASGTIVAAGATYGGLSGNSSIIENACLVDGCYTLTFFDSVNNGMCPFQSSATSSATFITPGTLLTPGSVVATLGVVIAPGLCGTYTLTDANGVTLASGGGSFGAQQTSDFCLTGGLAPLWHNDEDNMRQLAGTTNTDIQLVPNPVQNVLTVYYTLENADDVQLSVIDIAGKTVRTHNTANTSQVELDVNDLTAGFYFVRLVAGDTVIAKKFVKQ